MSSCAHGLLRCRGGAGALSRVPGALLPPYPFQSNGSARLIISICDLREGCTWPNTKGRNALVVGAPTSKQYMSGQVRNSSFSRPEGKRSWPSRARSAGSSICTYNDSRMMHYAFFEKKIIPSRISLGSILFRAVLSLKNPTSLRS